MSQGDGSCYTADVQEAAGEVIRNGPGLKRRERLDMKRRAFLKQTGRTAGTALALSAAQTLSAVTAAAESDAKSPGVKIQGGDLTAVIGDNREAESGDHRGGYNGIWSLTSRHQPRSPFVPFYAGFNLEHVFDSSVRVANGEHIFEPRKAPMSVERLSTASARLHQPPTPVTKLESWITFEVAPPDAIDVTLKILPHEKTWKDDLFGIFFASYMDEPYNKSLYLTSPRSGDPPRIWHQFCTPAHNVLSTMLHEKDTCEIDFEPSGAMLYKSFSPVRFDLPLMFGIVRGMALAFMVDRPDGVRLTHSPSGGGRWKDDSDTNPAWDMQFLVPNANVGQTYEWKVRILYRPYTNREAILEAYEAFQKTL